MSTIAKSALLKVNHSPLAMLPPIAVYHHSKSLFAFVEVAGRSMCFATADARGKR
jgi:hypothetical protein